MISAFGNSASPGTDPDAPSEWREPLGTTSDEVPHHLASALMEFSPLAIIVLDSEERVTLWNAAAESILGYRASEVIGRPLPVVSTHLASAFRAQPQHDSLRGVIHRGIETQTVHRDGTPLDIQLWTASLGHSPRKETAFTLAIVADVSARKQEQNLRQRLVERLVLVQEEERKRISRELHDQLGQQLTVVLMELNSLQASVEDAQGPDPEAFRTSIAHLHGLLDGLMRSSHRLAWELRPPELDDLGLETALQRYVADWGERTGTRTEYVAIGTAPCNVSQEAGIALYRAVQEALANVARHAQANRVSVIFECEPITSVIIEDNGVGMPHSEQVASAGRLGLTGIRERLLLVGGSLEIESAPGKGTTLYARVPNQDLDSEPTSGSASDEV